MELLGDYLKIVLVRLDSIEPQKYLFIYCLHFVPFFRVGFYSVFFGPINDFLTGLVNHGDCNKAVIHFVYNLCEILMKGIMVQAQGENLIYYLDILTEITMIISQAILILQSDGAAMLDTFVQIFSQMALALIENYSTLDVSNLDIRDNLEENDKQLASLDGLMSTVLSLFSDIIMTHPESGLRYKELIFNICENVLPHLHKSPEVASTVLSTMSDVILQFGSSSSATFTEESANRLLLEVSGIVTSLSIMFESLSYDDVVESLMFESLAQGILDIFTSLYVIMSERNFPVHKNFTQGVFQITKVFL